MPNVKVFMDEGLLSRKAAAADAMLGAIRSHLCRTLEVEEAACHIVLMPVRSAAGQAAVNIELALLRRQDRTSDRMAAVCGGLRDLCANQIESPCAVRCTMMEAEHYIVAR